MKLAFVLLALSTAALAACSGADIGEGVLGDDGGGGARGDGGASGTGSDPSGPGATTGSVAAGSTATSGPGGTASASTGPGGTSSVSSGPGVTASASSGGQAVCGDLVCNGVETCASCPNDCDECSDDCGNGICDAGESATCPQDCNPQSVASSSTGLTGQCPPDPCEAGGLVDSLCSDSCVLIVCFQDAACCDGTWSQTCADYAISFSGLGLCTC